MKTVLSVLHLIFNTIQFTICSILVFVLVVFTSILTVYFLKMKGYFFLSERYLRFK
ncbi:hypothetical protein BH23BAC1_BH23BAC1_03110 [soil metagenome]